MIAGGNFLECEETRALDVINGLSSFLVNDHRVDAIMDRLDEIEKKIDTLSLREVERPTQGGQDLLEIEGDWEPFIRIGIFNQNFLAYCDIGSMVSSMPKIVYDSVKFESMVDYPFYHAHANGDISKIVGKVNNVQVHFKDKNTSVDFIILESTNPGNIVLGRSFLKAMSCFIDVKKGQLSFRAPIKSKYLFPKNKKDILIEEVIDDSYDLDDGLIDKT